MELSLECTAVPGWPRLGWLAELDLGRRRCRAWHGPFVVVDPSPAPRWLFAGVWDGALEAGAFHRAETVFGSGVRLDGDAVHFVPPTTTTSRLFHLQEEDRTWVSNSLVLLLGRLGARLDPRADHRRWAEGSCLGLFEYPRDVPVVHPEHESVKQLLYSSLVVREHEVSFVQRDRRHAFTGYADYLGQLRAVLRSLHANASSPLRRRPVRLVSTASRGYDSPAVTALATELGAPVTCYSAPRSNTRIPRVAARLIDEDIFDDDGSDIARALGAEARPLPGSYEGLSEEMEAWLFASGVVSPELVFWPLFRDAEGSDALTVWFTGQNGDAAWSTHPRPRGLHGDLYRGSPSGYALDEARVRYGVVECAPPYVFARDIAALHRLSLAEELAPWRLGNDYDRPIPRRLLEERGIAREAFGFGKKAVAQDVDSPQGAALRAAFFADTQWTPLRERAYRATNLGLYLVGRAGAAVQARGHRAKMLKTGGELGKAALAAVLPRVDLRQRTFLFCVERLAGRFAVPEVAPSSTAVAAKA